MFIVVALSLELFFNVMMIINYYVKTIKKVEVNCKIFNYFSCNISNYSSQGFTVIAMYYYYKINSNIIIIGSSIIITIIIEHYYNILNNNCCYQYWYQCQINYMIAIIKQYYSTTWQLNSNSM